MKNEIFVRHVWLVNGYPDYFVGDDNKMYPIKKDVNVRACKLTQIGYSQGYVLKSHFFTLNRLRSRLPKNEMADAETMFLIIKDQLNKLLPHLQTTIFKTSSRNKAAILSRVDYPEFQIFD